LGMGIYLSLILFTGLAWMQKELHDY
jgi:hypothetical protein